MTGEDTPPYVRVSLDTIYNKLIEVDKKLDPVPEIVSNQGERLRKLEIQTAVQWVGFGLLIAVVGGSTIGALFQ